MTDRLKKVVPVGGQWLISSSPTLPIPLLATAHPTILLFPIPDSRFPTPYVTA
ncbi:hypothetical protein [Moorena producens]|uniref:hypothetical protein n=1 Tax=Moorena producens TaxID=1155739 RepID=UPI003C778BBA